VNDGLSRFSASEIETLKALVDTVIPADDWPAGWEGGVQRLLKEHGSDFLAGPLDVVAIAIGKADEAAALRGKAGFVELTAGERSALLSELIAVEEPTEALFPPSRVITSELPLSSLVSIAYQGFYGGTREPAGWKMVGFSSVPEGVTPVDSAPPAGIRSSEVKDFYDVIVIGAGAGGGIAAAELARRGQSVLLVDRSVPMRDSELRGNHLQGKRTSSYDTTVGPHAGNPRILVHSDGREEVLPGEGNGLKYGLTAMALGGGTRVWQGMSWRFWHEDFAMASVYGSPEGSTLVDWPFGYDELAPYYDRVEWELGVSGDAQSAVGLAMPRLRDYPMPPMPSDVTRVAFTEAAHRIGWQTSPIPFSINSVARDGREACVRCSQCIGHACPVNAKNGTHNTFIPRALATGNCDLLLSAQVLEIEHDGRGTATGVRMMVDTGTQPVGKSVRTAQIVVSAGAVETPRLLLASALGNSWVGRNHHSHGLAMALAANAPDVKTNIGPGHSVATIDRMHHNGEAWGGGVIFDAAPPYPVEKAEYGRSRSGSHFGAVHKKWMRESPDLVGSMSMVQEVPHEATRVAIDPVVRDRFGMPAARLSGRVHDATRESVSYMADHCASWMTALGATELTRVEGYGSFAGSEHSAGTVRMGNDPALAAADARGLLWGTSNVYVADASLHPTNGGFNPALTAMANAMRVANLLADSL
jgi:choline dehydrogenase-like flavoprotein